MNASHHSQTAPLEKSSLSTAVPSQRQSQGALNRLPRMGVGLVITLFPLAAWGLVNLMLGPDYVEKNSWRVHLDPVQIRIWLLIAAGLLELIAVFVLRKADQKPRDPIAIISLIDTGLSILLAVFFWAQISLLIFGAT